VTTVTRDCAPNVLRARPCGTQFRRKRISHGGFHRRRSWLCGNSRSCAPVKVAFLYNQIAQSIILTTFYDESLM
jgi:hypothetical protein